MVDLGVKKIYDDVVLPSKATEGAACFDVRAYIKETNCALCDLANLRKALKAPPVDHHQTENSHILINPGETKAIPTGIVLDIPVGYEVEIRPRSGLSLRTGLRIANSPGTIDYDYTQELKIIVTNTGNDNLIISHGERICQAKLSIVPEVRIVEVSEISSKDSSRSGGLGHTGVM